MSKGYILLYRKILDNPIINKDSDHIAVWIYLLLNATHQDYDIEHLGKRFTLKRGQLVTGRKVIAEKYNISETKVQRILKRFESEHQIEQQTTNKNRIVTILNYDNYQISEQQNEQQMNNKRTTTEQQLNTNNKHNKQDKQNQHKEKDTVFDDFVAWFMKNYRGKKTKKTRDSKLPKILKKYGSEELKRAVARYMEETKDREPQFIKHEGTWWNGGYMDYLDENYQPINKTKNREPREELGTII